MNDPRDRFELSDIFAPLEMSDGLIFKSMFGGLAVYSEGLMKFTLAESEGDNEWKGNRYDFPIWNGLLVCTEHAHQESLVADFPGLISHPVLPKWLYLPLLEDESEFRDTARALIHAALKKDPRIGIVPKKKSKKKKKSRKRSR